MSKRFRSILVGCIAASAAACGDSEVGEPPGAGDGTSLAGRAGDIEDSAVGAAPAARAPSAAVVFEERHERAADERAQPQRTFAADDPRALAARPWEHLAKGEVYDSDAWQVTDEHGNTTHGYRVTKRAVKPPVARQRAARAPRIADDLAAAIAAGPTERRVRVLVRTPVALPPAIAGAHGEAAARDDAREQRRAAFHAAAAPVAQHIEALGGRVVTALASIGWLAAEMPLGAIESLTSIGGVGDITLDEEPTPGANPVALGSLRGADFFDVQDFWDAGFHGNGFSTPIRVGVTETQGLEDEACFLDDVPGDECDANERLEGRFMCDAADCDSVANFTDESTHGTIVSSIIAADYTQGQGASTFGGLPAGWQDRATGVAKEVRLHYYDIDSEAAMVSAFDCAGGDTTLDADCQRLDVTNSSVGWTAGRCDATSQRASEAAVENLWDEGTLPVIIAHNQGEHPTCKTTSPGDIPKAFTVAALEAAGGVDYDDWDIASYSNNGGADIEVGGVVRSGTMSITDLAAPGNPNYVTSRLSNGVGDIMTGYSGQGTSFAGPAVAGAAALVKEWMIAGGHAWIDDPGRLHAVMLGMGDRGTKFGGATADACINGAYIQCGADTYFGLGRLHLKRPDAFTARTNTFTETTDLHTEAAFGGNVMANDTAMVKCVTQQREDMVDSDGGGGKDDISLVSLKVRIRDAVGGACVAGSGTVRYTRFDALYDDKHMVAILDSSVNLGGRCLELELDPVTLSSAGSVTTHTYCYADDALDH